MIKKILLPILTLACTGFFSVVPSPAAASQIIKGESNSAVYYVYGGGRYAFPNDRVYFTWYKDFSGVSVISDKELASIPLKGNVTYRPGAKMVKITTDPKVYTVSQGGMLRWVTNEVIASWLYGNDWASYVEDIPDAFFTNYKMGALIVGAGDFSKDREYMAHESFVPNAPPLSYSSGEQSNQPQTGQTQNTQVTENTETTIPQTNQNKESLVDPCANVQKPLPIPPRTAYVIITRPMFEKSLESFISKKSSEGRFPSVYKVDDIACAEEGTDIQAKMRNFLKRVSEKAPMAKYVLFVGAPDPADKGRGVTKLNQSWEVPIRYVSNAGEYPYSQDPTPTDQYFASVNQYWPDTGTEWMKNFDFSPRFYVGRVPVTTAGEVEAWANKTMAWTTPTNPVHSRYTTSFCKPGYSDSWMNLDTQVLKNDTHKMIIHNCSADNGGDIATLSNLDGADYVSSFSHGSYQGITKWPATKGYDLTKQSPGFVKKPVMYVHGCEVGGLDYAEPSLAQKLIGDANGITAFVGSARSHWDLEFPFWESVFFDGNTKIGPALYEAKAARFKAKMLSLYEIDNLFMFNLFGDPELELVKPMLKMTPKYTEIYGNILNKTSNEMSYSIQNISNNPISSSLKQSMATQPLTSPVFTAPAMSTITATANVYSAIAEKVEMLPQNIYVKTGACNNGNACIIKPIKIIPPLPFSCARYRTVNGNQGQIDLRFDAGSDEAVNLVIKGRGAVFTEDTNVQPPEPQVLKSIPDQPVKGGIVTLTWDLKASDAVPTGNFTGVYYGSTYHVEARDSENVLLGTCVISNASEPNVP